MNDADLERLKANLEKVDSLDKDTDKAMHLFFLGMESVYYSLLGDKGNCNLCYTTAQAAAEYYDLLDERRKQ